MYTDFSTLFEGPLLDSLLDRSRVSEQEYQKFVDQAYKIRIEYLKNIDRYVDINQLFHIVKDSVKVRRSNLNSLQLICSAGKCCGPQCNQFGKSFKQWRPYVN